MNNIEKMKLRKKEMGLTNQEISERSGVPVGTVNKIFSGATKSPQYSTVTALETALGMFSYHDQEGSYVSAVKEAEMAYDLEGRFTVKDYENLPDYVHAELIDGTIYYMAALGTAHQELLGELFFAIKTHIQKNAGKCRVFMAPFGVRLNQDDKTVVQPDLCVVCQSELLNEKGLNGAPDFVIEIVSPGTEKKDYTIKMKKYWDAGVREYWIVDLLKERVVTYTFDNQDMNMKIYGIQDVVDCSVMKNLKIDFKGLLRPIL